MIGSTRQDVLEQTACLLGVTQLSARDRRIHQRSGFLGCQPDRLSELGEGLRGLACLQEGDT